MGFIQYFKAEPTEFARVSVNGNVKKQGVGISKIYLPFRTSIEVVDVAAKDHPFAFRETSSDNQELSIQGGLVYRVTKPEVVLSRYNFAVDPNTKQRLSEDLNELPEHLIHLVQSDARAVVETTNLEKLLNMSEELSRTVLDGLQKNEAVKGLGIGVELLYISSIKPKPEIAKALEANYRESLLQRADEAIYKRRAEAVEKERAIRENELKTEVELEEKRKRLVELQGVNTLREAEIKAEALRKEFSGFGEMNPAMLTAHALYQLGLNAGRIENLSLTPDILTSMMNGMGLKK